MDTLITAAQIQLHPIVNHFPIVLLVVRVALDGWGCWQPNLRYSAWLALLIGTFAAIPTVITGLIAHAPYEETAASTAISQHEQLGVLTTALFIALTIWRWRARRRDTSVPASWLYLAIGIVGLGVLTLTGFTGGNLVFDLGVGVREIVR